MTLKDRSDKLMEGKGKTENERREERQESTDSKRKGNKEETKRTMKQKGEIQ